MNPIRFLNPPTLKSWKNIASALGVEIKDLLEFAHLKAGGVKIEEIEQLLRALMRRG